MTSSDNAAIVNPVQEDISLPDLTDGELFVERLEYLLNKMASSINTKEGGLYTLNELGSFQKYYNQNNPQEFRNVYRKVIDLIELNNGDIEVGQSVSFPHEISGVSESAFIYANCTTLDKKRFSLADETVYVDNVNVYFTNPSGERLSQCDIVINVTKES